MISSSFTILTVHVDGRQIALRRSDVRVVEEELPADDAAPTDLTRVRLFDQTEYVVDETFEDVMTKLLQPEN